MASRIQLSAPYAGGGTGFPKAWLSINTTKVRQKLHCIVHHEGGS